LDEALAANATPTPIPVHATAVVARMIFSLGAANASPSRMVILPNRRLLALQIVASALCTSCALSVHSPSQGLVITRDQAADQEGAEVLALVMQGKKVQARKKYRSIFHVSLTEAKAFADSLVDQ
jgi:hypothetical protein